MSPPSCKPTTAPLHFARIGSWLVDRIAPARAGECASAHRSRKTDLLGLYCKPEERWCTCGTALQKRPCSSSNRSRKSTPPLAADVYPQPGLALPHAHRARCPWVSPGSRPSPSDPCGPRPHIHHAVPSSAAVKLTGLPMPRASSRLGPLSSMCFLHCSGAPATHSISGPCVLPSTH